MNRSPGPYIEVLRESGLSSTRVEAWAEGMLRDGRAPNLQAAVYRDGRPALSLATGRAPSGARVDRGSLYCILSCTKLFTSLAMLALHDRGYFEFDQPIAEQWPEFGTLGKERITFRHLLSHRAGIRLGPPGTTWPAWGDREAYARLLTPMKLEWEPGEKIAYHNRNFGFLLDYMVWRWLGKGIGQFLQDEVFAPLHIANFHYGISRELYERRLVKVVAVRGPEGQPLRRAPEADRQGQDPEFRPSIGGEGNMFNSFELLSLPLTWGTACASAEAAAEVANFWSGRGLYKTVRLFSRETFAEATARPPPVPSPDGDEPADFALGVRLGWFAKLEHAGSVLGHGGGTTAVVWVDVDKGVTAACFLGGVAPSDIERQRYEFAAAVYADLGL